MLIEKKGQKSKTKKFFEQLKKQRNEEKKR